MKTAFWAPYISDGTIKAICWTLIHSLWIGLVIALLCGIIIASTRKSAALARYRLLCGLLVLFVCAIGVTYYMEARVSTPLPIAGKLNKVMITGTTHIVIKQLTPRNQSLLGNVQTLLNQNMNIIFMVWLLFFMFKSMKMVSGLLYIQRIRNYKTHPVTEDLKNRIEYLSSQIGIGRVVRLVQSELVKVPVAIGWLKPMILLPVGIALQLTPEQLDGILWHELAHIRRRDCLVNILQGLVETVFFFNPGLLWLSSLIRTEREACCDDMVLSRMNRKANYLEALLSFGYGEFNQARYAMSIGSGNQLRDRLKRMISQENKRLSVAEKAVLAVGLLLLTAFTTISKDNPVVKQLKVKFNGNSGKVSGKKMTEAMTISMHHLSDSQRGIDNKPEGRQIHTILTSDTSIRFTSVLFKQNDADLNNSDVSAMDDKGNKYHFVVADGKIMSMEINGNKVADDKLADYDFIKRNIGRELATKRRMRETDLVDPKAADLGARTKYDRVKAGIKLRDSMRVDAQGDVLPKYMQYSVDAKRHKFEQMKMRMNNDSIHYYTQLNRAKQVIGDLVTENVVPTAEAVTWFGLTENELIVNGNKQTEELHLKLMKKYGIHKDYGLFYGPVKMTGRGVFVGDDADNRAYPQGRGKDMLALEREKMVSDKFRKMQYSAQEREKLYNEDINHTDVSVSNEKQMEQKLKQLKGRYSPKAEIDVESAISGVISDLMDANIIKDRSDINFFNLTNTELIVNGKKLSEEIHQKLKTKYLSGPTYKFNSDIGDDPNFGLHFNSKNGTRGIGITRRQDSPW